ncbi:uncharacterized protein LOC126984484 [Eriocheir sinensis]|uniref:uncharacterized protein LOC126984484 n=1 Tax=Eriocheir sinensis TaxID=95602 RepID=UPI0021C79EB3|nr:uncharacterized protein LOC126984484 [Eriocheir sinensis]
MEVVVVVMMVVMVVVDAAVDRLALLAGTLRTFQQHACDGTTLALACPTNTTIDVAFARYGRPRTTHAHSDSLGVGGGDGDAVGAVGGAGGPVNERDPCPPLPRSHPHASLGVSRGCEYPDKVNYNTIQLVVSRCQHQQQCSIEVAPHTFSPTDPCPDTRKYIEVAYKCRPKTFINKVVCEGGQLSVGCDKEARLAIYSVLFGRSRTGSFTCPQPEGVAEEECQASYANEIVMRQCHGQRECHLEASPEVFGNPCSPQSNVYMKTVYTCVPKKILKQTQDEEGGGGGREDTEGDEGRGGGGRGRKGGHEEGSLRSPAAPGPSPSSPTPPRPHQHNLLTSTTSFYNPTVTTWLSDRKSDERDRGGGGGGREGGGDGWGREGVGDRGREGGGREEIGGGGREDIGGGEGGGGGGSSQWPPPQHPAGAPSPPLQPELINCTVTILAGAQGREIGFLTEWMRAVAFVKSNFEKFLLYLLLGLCAGLVMFLVVVVGQLLWERRRAKRAAKTMHDPLTSVFAADIDDIDADLDLDGTGMGGGGGGSSLGISGLGVMVAGGGGGGVGAGGSLPRTSSPHDPSRAQHREVMRYNAYSTYGGRSRSGEDGDGNPLSLTRTNNNQLFYS